MLRIDHCGFGLFQESCIFIYNGPPLIRRLLGYGKPGCIRGVLSCEGYMTHSYRVWHLVLWPYKRGGLW